jgi:hypothetical protein
MTGCPTRAQGIHSLYVVSLLAGKERGWPEELQSALMSVQGIGQRRTTTELGRRTGRIRRTEVRDQSACSRLRHWCRYGKSEGMYGCGHVVDLFWAWTLFPGLQAPAICETTGHPTLLIGSLSSNTHVSRPSPPLSTGEFKYPLSAPLPWPSKPLMAICNRIQSRILFRTLQPSWSTS